MSQNRVDSEVPQLRQLQERWLRLPLSYRVNALLYFLGACATLFLVTSLLRGGDDNPRQIQVGAGTGTTATTRPGPASSAASPVPSTTGGPSTSSTTSRPTSTTAGSGQTATTSSGGGGGGAAGGGGGGGGGGSNTTAPPGNGGTTTPPQGDTTPPSTPGSTAPSTTTTVLVCRNSSDPSCGQWFWDPAPSNNQPLSIDIAISPGNPRVGQDVTFSVTVSDPDHPVGTCAWLDFGDLTSQGMCQPPPCPARHGAWDPPARVADTRTLTFTHRYSASGPYIATFYVNTRTDCYDPYGGEATRNAPIVVDPGT